MGAVKQKGEWMLWPHQTWKKPGKPWISHTSQYDLWEILPHGCQSEQHIEAPASRAHAGCGGSLAGQLLCCSEHALWRRRGW